MTILDITKNERMKKYVLIILTATSIVAAWNAIPCFKEWKRSSSYQGCMADEWLKILAKDSNFSTNALTLKIVPARNESDIVNFEVPISYDVLAHGLSNSVGKLNLLVDDEDVSLFDRAANGNCAVAWNTAFNPPGKHKLQAQLIVGGRSGTRALTIRGPVFYLLTTNLIQFDPFYLAFDEMHGATLHAKVFLTNVFYSIEIKNPSGQHIKTITGKPSNGEIRERWDLIDDYGNKCTNDEFVTEFHLTLSDGTTITNIPIK